MFIFEILRPRQKTLIVMCYDIAIIVFAYFFSYSLRFSTILPDVFYSQEFYPPFLISLVVQFASFYLGGVYRAIWRFSSTPDLIRIIKSVTMAVMASLIAIFLWNRLENVPRSTFIINWLLLVTGLGGGRFSYRIFRDYMKNQSLKKENHYTNVLIVGAGAGGEKLFREIRENPNLQLNVVGFLDDDPGKINKSLHGKKVLGKISQISEMAEKHAVKKTFIAIPSANSVTMRTIVDHCKDTGLDIKTLPKMSDILFGKVDFSLLRNVGPEDLLGRESINLNLETVEDLIGNKVIMVTGAGGSIGSELCRQILKLKPKKLVLFEQTEYFLYELENDLRANFPEADFVSIIGDVRNKQQVQNVIASMKPQVLFHAAAYKHVPMMEKNPFEAIRTNIFGTKNVAEAALHYKIEKFVLISTDKAINPTNIMGTTKSVAEQICQRLSQNQTTKFMTVRFGNVLGSSGSVVPLFKKQIENGGPVTVTHPEIKRYFMSIPEATQLVIQAAALGKGGEVFVLEMGNPVKIVDLAKEMITLAGFKLDQEIKIEFTGLRPGEKLFEELFFDDEHTIPTSHEKVRIAKSRKCHPDLDKLILYLTELPENSPKNIFVEILKTIVPEFKTKEEEREDLHQH